VHVEDAAAATVAALECPAGVYNVVDDDPSVMSVWLPAFAASVGAPEPQHISERKPSSKQGPTPSTMRLNCGALQTQRRDEILPLRQDGSNGSPEQKPQAGHDPGGLGLTEKAKTHQAA
jgi:hypothetical protein